MAVTQSIVYVRNGDTTETLRTVTVTVDVEKLAVEGDGGEIREEFFLKVSAPGVTNPWRKKITGLVEDGCNGGARDENGDLIDTDGKSAFVETAAAVSGYDNGEYGDKITASGLVSRSTSASGVIAVLSASGYSS